MKRLKTIIEYIDGTHDTFEDTDDVHYQFETDESGVKISCVHLQYTGMVTGTPVNPYVKSSSQQWVPSCRVKDIRQLRVNNSDDPEPPKVMRTVDTHKAELDDWLHGVIDDCTAAKNVSSRARDVSGSVFNNSAWLHEVFDKTDARADWIIDSAVRSVTVASVITVSGEPSHLQRIAADAHELLVLANDTLNLLLTLDNPREVVELRESRNTLAKTIDYMKGNAS
jgi:hypothetical protein